MKLFNNFIVHTQNIRNNILNFKQYCKDIKICAVVKADAYGHGIEGVACKIKDIVDFFGVADEKEAMKVRNISAKPILILNLISSVNFAWAIQNCVSLSVGSFKYLKQLNVIAKKLNKKVKIHLKINTGMNRLGISKQSDFKKILNYINSSKNIILEGIYTHFFDSANTATTEKQYQKFCAFLNLLDTKNVIVHASSSNAAILNKKYVFDMVRLGILMYGYLDFSAPLKLNPAVTITSQVVNVVKIKKGQCVGYGSNFVAKSNIKVATVSLGYADGFLRANSNIGKVIVKDKICSIVGNICMNLFMIDVTNINCKIGDEVIILGTSDTQKIDAQDIANLTHTICYEVLTNFKRDRMNYVLK